MTISICIKSGTGNYYDYDGCDMLLKELKNQNFHIPRIHETIEFWEPNDERIKNQQGKTLIESHEYLVTDVCYQIVDEENFSVRVYMVPIGRKTKKGKKSQRRKHL